MSENMAEKVEGDNAEIVADTDTGASQEQTEQEHATHHKKKHSHEDEYLAKIKEYTQEQLIEELGATHKMVHDLEKEIENCKKTASEKEKESLDYLDRYRRSLAEVENVRRRAQNEKQDSLKYANFSIISDLTTILDDFERALEHGKSDSADLGSVVEGVELIEKQFADLLFKKYGVEKYGTAGDAFDPNIHQAMMMEEGDYKTETLVDVFRKGYKLHERVIRPAQVKIGKPQGC